MYELVIVWSSGETEVFKCPDKESAEKAERGYKKAFGNQVEWSGIRERSMICR